jgi:hypothetical protein
MKIAYSSSVTALREVAPGLVMGLPGQATFTDVELEGTLYRVEMTLDLTAEGIRPTSVCVTSQPGNAPVSGTTLRAVRVWDLAREVIVTNVMPGRGDVPSGGIPVTIGQGPDVSRLRALGPVDETLKWVAYFYNLAGILGLPPAKQVETALGVPRTTASKWVRRARDRGLIPSRDDDAPTPVAARTAGSAVPLEELHEWLGWKDKN